MEHCVVLHTKIELEIKEHKKGKKIVLLFYLLMLLALLLGAGPMGIDAVPMKGIDIKTLDTEFGLREK